MPALGSRGRIKPHKWLFATVFAALSASLIVHVAGRDLIGAKDGWQFKLGLWIVQRFDAGLADRWADWVVGSGFWVVFFALFFVPALFFFARAFAIAEAVRELVWPSPPRFLDRQLSRDRARPESPFKAGEPFVGRETELEKLRGFAGRPAAGLRWTAVTGPMGMGKTRLALVAMARLKTQRWDVGLLKKSWDSGELDPPTFLQLHGFRRDTLIVIDDCQALGEALWQVLHALAENPTRRRLRVVLVDQAEALIPSSLDPDQYASIERKYDRGDCLNIGELSDAEAGRLAPGFDASTKVRTEMRPLLLKLGPNPWAVLESRAARRLALAREIFADSGPKLLALAALAGEVAIEESAQSSPEIERIMMETSDIGGKARLFEGASREFLKTAIPELRPTLFAHEVFLQWVEEHDLPACRRLIEACIGSRPDHARWFLESIVRERPDLAAAGATGKRARALQSVLPCMPDAWKVAGEQKALQWGASLSKSLDLESTRNVLKELEVLLRLWPASEPIRLACAIGYVKAIIIYGGAAKAQGGNEPDWRLLQGALERLDNLADAESAKPEIRLACAKGYVNASFFYGNAAEACAAAGKASDWRLLQGALERLDALADAEDASPEIRLRCAMGYFNASNSYRGVAEAQATDGKPPDWRLLQGALKRLDALADAGNASPAIRLECAKGYFNATASYGNASAAQAADGKAPDWRLLQGALARLDALAGAADASREIRLRCAQGYFNASDSYRRAAEAQATGGEAPDWRLLQGALKRLDALADAADASPEIRLACAQGYFNASISYGEAAGAQAAGGEAPDWRLLQGALKRLDALADAADASPEIRLLCANGHVDASNSYRRAAEAQAVGGETPDWRLLQGALKRLDALADAENASPEIRSECAKGYVNATVSYGDAAEAQATGGKAPDWRLLQGALKRLDALADTEDASPEIRLACAMGYYNASNSYRSAAEAQAADGKAPDWRLLQGALNRLDALADAGDASPKIKFECARGYFNASASYGKAAEALAATGEALAERDAISSALRRLCELALGPRSSAEIARLSCRACLFGESICRTLDHPSGRAIAYRGLKEIGWQWPDDPEIQQMLQLDFPTLTHRAQFEEREAARVQHENFKKSIERYK